MDGLMVSQVLSLSAAQSEIDRTTKAHQLSESLELSNEQVFLKVLDRSMQEVNQLLSTEKEDRVLSEEDEEDQEQDEKKDRE